ncbi:MAG: tetratricopeptide repeat protein [Candidatus Sumerlaeaceae bacterium]|nr:tetratricopeptide repeat protein [Candidatus Sumerlaeaceae bacterium]
MRVRLLYFCFTAVLVLGIAPAPVSGRSPRPNPERSEAIELLARGAQMEDAGNLEEAMAAYSRSAQLAPSPAAFYRLGAACERAGRKQDARGYYAKALELNPEYEQARLALAQLGGGGSRASAGGGAVNVDRLQQENETLRSLRTPASLLTADSSEVKRERSYSALLKRRTPAAPQNAEAGRPPRVPASRTAALPGEAVRNAAIPPQQTIVENDSTPVIVENGPVAASASRGVTLKAPRSAASGSQEPAGGEVPRMASEAGGYTPSGVTPAARGGAGQGAAGGMPSAEAINAAAFSAEARAEPGSIVYGNHSKVALGTFAFHRDRGDSYRSANRWAEAATEYETALRLEPGDLDTRTLYAEALARAGRTAEGEAQFDKAAEIAPGDSRVPYRRANMLRETGRVDQAVGAYLEAIELDPNNKFAHNNLGVVYMQKGQYTKAAQHFERVLEIDPSYDKAMLNLGIIYDDHLGDKAKALKYYDQYLAAKGERSAEVRRWADAIRGVR